jgi:hypothetical protein
MGPITELIGRAQRGERDAFDALFQALYPQLRQLAHARLARHARGTLMETTALLHEEAFENYNRWARTVGAQTVYSRRYDGTLTVSTGGVTVTAGGVTVTAGGASMSAPAVDGKFPDYARVIPRDLTGKTGQFNPRYVADAYAAVLELNNGKACAPQLQHNGTGGALMTFERFAAVIMPWRCGEDAIDARLLYPVGAAVPVPADSEVAS